MLTAHGFTGEAEGEYVRKAEGVYIWNEKGMDEVSVIADAWS